MTLPRDPPGNEQGGRVMEPYGGWIQELHFRVSWRGAERVPTRHDRGDDPRERRHYRYPLSWLVSQRIYSVAASKRRSSVRDSRSSDILSLSALEIEQV